MAACNYAIVNFDTKLPVSFHTDEFFLETPGWMCLSIQIIWGGGDVCMLKLSMESLLSLNPERTQHFSEGKDKISKVIFS